MQPLVAAHRDAEALAALDALPAGVRAEPRVGYLRARLLEVAVVGLILLEFTVGLLRH